MDDDDQLIDAGEQDSLLGHDGDEANKPLHNAASGPREYHGPLHPTASLFQWVGLFVIGFLALGTSVAYDSVGALGPLYKRSLHISAEGLADLYSVYHLPNLVMVFFGGLLTDRIGTRRASMLFNTFVVLGVAIVAASRTLGFMLLGRFIFGIGSETLSVVQLGILSRWYSHSPRPPSLGLACAFTLTLSRVGTLVAFDVLPIIGEGSNGLRAALWTVVFVCVGCYIANIIFLRMDTVISPYLPAAFDEVNDRGARQRQRQKDQRQAATQAAAKAKRDAERATNGHARNGKDGTSDEDGSSTHREMAMNSPSPLSETFQSLRMFSSAFWLIVAICIFHYSVVISFSDFSADFFHEQFGYSAEKASRVQSVTTIIGLVLTPVCGWMADEWGRRASMMMFGSMLLVPAHLLVGIFSTPPLSSCILQGLASALVCAALWPSIPLVLPEHLVNTAVGLMTAMQNCALFVVPLIVGEIRERSGSYRPSMQFYIVMDVGAIAMAWYLLQFSDSEGRNILELPTKQIFSSSTSEHDQDSSVVDDHSKIIL